MNDSDVLAEIEDILRTAPPRTTLLSDVPETFAWLGRTIAAISRWNSEGGARARKLVSQMQNVRSTEAQQRYNGLMVLLHEACNDLRMTTIGPINAAIGQGLIFDYFDGIRKIIMLASSDLLFVDPYLDAEFVSRYLPQVRSGVQVRLLVGKKEKQLAALSSAVKLFAQQHQMHIGLRSTPNLHDRYIIVDGWSCYQSGASFKDGARTAPTTRHSDHGRLSCCS
jgi:hypothetical protein